MFVYHLLNYISFVVKCAETQLVDLKRVDDVVCGFKISKFGSSIFPISFRS